MKNITAIKITKFLNVLLLVTILIGILIITSTSAPIAQAASCSEDQEGTCIDNKICVCRAPDACFNDGSDCGSSQIGGVKMPGSIKKYNDEVWRGDGIGIVLFLSNLTHLFAIVAGIFAMFNFALAGYIFVSSGDDSGAMKKASDKILWTAIGLVLIVAAYTITGLIGALFFGNAGFFLEPTLYSVLDTP